MTRTNTDRIDQLAKESAETSGRVNNLDRRVEEDVKKLRESLADQERLLAGESERVQSLEISRATASERETNREKEVARLRSELDEERKGRVALQVEVAALKQQLADHIKATDLADGRRWALIVLLLGAVLSLASGLIVTLAKK